MTDVGTNSGVTGLITLHGGNQPFNGKIDSWDAGIGNIIINRAGPGADGPKVRCEQGSGSLTINALVNKEGYPFPKSLENTAGDVVLQWDKNVTVTVPVMISSVSFKQGADKNQWVLRITAALNGVVVVAGFNGAQVVSSINLSDQSLWDGRRKIVDPASLGDTDFETIDVAGLANATGAAADAADLAKVASVIASATPPRVGMKVVSAAIVRTGGNGGRVSLQWGVDNAADRIIKGAKSDAEDSVGLSKTASRAVIHLAGDDPTYPDTPTGLKLAGQNTQPLTGSIYAVTIFRYAIDDPKDEIENQYHVDQVDPAGISPESTRGKLHNNGEAAPEPDDVPAGLKPTAESTRVLNNNKAVTVRQYGVDDAKDRIENGQARDIIDPDALRSEATRGVVHNPDVPATPPAAPAAGLKLVTTQNAVINNAKTLTTFRYGLRTIKEQIENDGTTWSYSTELSGNGRSVTIIEHYTGPFETWRIAYKDAFYADAEARSITFRRFVFSGAGATETGTVFVTKTYRAQTASVDFMGLWKVEAGNAVAYTDHRGIYRDGDAYKVFVIRNIGFSDTIREVTFGMIVSGIRRSFRIIRKSSGSPPDAFAALVGKTNNAPFLGYPAGMVKYAGYAPKQLSETIWTGTYDCVADTNGHIDRNGAVVGGAIPYNSTAPVSGATLTIPSDVNAFPYVKIATQADLSSLVAS